MVTCCDYIYIFMRGYLHHERHGTANVLAKPERCKDKDHRHYFFLLFLFVLFCFHGRFEQGLKRAKQHQLPY